MGDIPTLNQVLVTMLAQWDDGGKEVAMSKLSKRDYEDLESAIQTIESIYNKHAEPRDKLIERRRAQLEKQLKKVTSIIADLDKGLAHEVIIHVETAIKLSRQFLKAYERALPLPEES